MVASLLHDIYLLWQFILYFFEKETNVAQACPELK